MRAGDYDKLFLTEYFGELKQSLKEKPRRPGGEPEGGGVMGIWGDRDLWSAPEHRQRMGRRRAKGWSPGAGWKSALPFSAGRPPLPAGAGVL